MEDIKCKLEAIYDQFSQQMFVCALDITGCHSSAEDAMHEAFCRCFGMRQDPVNLKAYVFRSVRNAAIDIIRRKKRLTTVELDYIFDDSDGPSQSIEQRQFKQEIARVLLKLSADERETIVQHLYADLTFREISEMRQRSLGTVVTWYRRGLAKLKLQLGKNPLAVGE